MSVFDQFSDRKLSLSRREQPRQNDKDNNGIISLECKKLFHRGQVSRTAQAIAPRAISFFVGALWQEWLPWIGEGRHGGTTLQNHDFPYNEIALL